MRERQGQPDDTVMPLVRLHGEAEPLCSIITVLCRRPEFSVVPEFRHMLKQSMDPAKVRDTALKFLSAGYYQSAGRFSDVLTATFAAASLDAARLARAGRCVLEFNANSHHFVLHCRVLDLERTHHLFESTWLHNRFFNPSLGPDLRVFGFEPDWDRSEAALPGMGGGRALRIRPEPEVQ